MKELANNYPVEVHWRSFELRPPGSPPIPAAYRARIEAMRPQLYAIARERFGVELNPGPFEQNSRPALIGAKYAEAHGASAAYHDAVFAAYWQQARAIDDRQELGAIAAAIGLDREGFLAALAAPEYLEAVLADVAQAQAYGLSGVPAHVFNERYLVSGAQPYEVFVEVYERLRAEQPDS